MLKINKVYVSVVMMMAVMSAVAKGEELLPTYYDLKTTGVQTKYPNINIASWNEDAVGGIYGGISSGTLTITEPENVGRVEIYARTNYAGVTCVINGISQAVNYTSETLPYPIITYNLPGTTNVVSISYGTPAGYIVQIERVVTYVVVKKISIRSPASYVVFKEDNLVKAQNGLTGKIDYSGASAATVINNALNNGYMVFVKDGTYTLSSAVTIPPNKCLQGTGRGTIFSSGMITAPIIISGYGTLSDVRITLDPTNNRGIKATTAFQITIKDVLVGGGGSASIGDVGVELNGSTQFASINRLSLEWLNTGLLLSGTGAGDRPFANQITELSCCEVGIGVDEVVGGSNTFIGPKMTHRDNGIGFRLAGIYDKIIGGHIELGVGSTGVKLLSGVYNMQIETALNCPTPLDTSLISPGTQTPIFIKNPYSSSIVEVRHWSSLSDESRQMGGYAVPIFDDLSGYKKTNPGTVYVDFHIAAKMRLDFGKIKASRARLSVNGYVEGGGSAYVDVYNYSVGQYLGFDLELTNSAEDCVISAEIPATSPWQPPFTTTKLRNNATDQLGLVVKHTLTGSGKNVFLRKAVIQFY